MSFAGNNNLKFTTNSQYDQGQFADGHCTITNGEQNITFYPLNMTWTGSHSNARGSQESWKNNKELETGLKNVLIGDFPDCLKKLSPHSREMPSKKLGRLAQGNIHRVGKIWQFS